MHNKFESPWQEMTLTWWGDAFEMWMRLGIWQEDCQLEEGDDEMQQICGGRRNNEDILLAQERRPRWMGNIRFEGDDVF